MGKKTTENLTEEQQDAAELADLAPSVEINEELPTMVQRLVVPGYAMGDEQAIQLANDLIAQANERGVHCLGIVALGTRLVLLLEGASDDIDAALNPEVAA